MYQAAYVLICLKKDYLTQVVHSYQLGFIYLCERACL